MTTPTDLIPSRSRRSSRPRPRRLRGAAAVAISAVLAAFVMAGCQYPNFEGDPESPHVVVLGDSITSVSEPDIRAALSDRYRSVSADPGITAGTIADYAHNYNPWAAEGGTVVVNAGTNDWPSGDVGRVFDALAAIRDHFTGECLVVTTLNEHTAIAGLNDFAATFNFYLVFSGEWPHVMDLSGLARAHQEQFSDTLHPDPGEGTLLYAALVRDAVLDCEAATEPPLRGGWFTGTR
jgi:hypothetical protein